MHPKTIFQTKFGSQLYGLQTPTSDTDYKSVYVPGYRELALLGPLGHLVTQTKTGEGKNTADDVDMESMALLKYLRLVTKGEMIAVDMMFSPKPCWTHATKHWEIIVDNRRRLVTRKLDAYLGYVRKQTSNYSNKGNRLTVLEQVLSALEQSASERRMVEIWDTLPLFPGYAEFCVSEGPNRVMIPMYEVCGRRFGQTTHVGTVTDSLRAIVATYGKRARKAQDAGGADWKALHHAVRCCYQMIDLHTTGELRFPFIGEQHNVLMSIKTGQMAYEAVVDIMESLLTTVELVACKSLLPETLDSKFVEELYMELITL